MIEKIKNFIKERYVFAKWAIIKNKHKKNPSFHQLTNTTKENRYPEIFGACKELCPDPKLILSYGCSTGEEVFTLERYFPNSEIHGIDINAKNIKVARSKNNSNSIYFHFNVDEINIGKPALDLIFAMSVLCRWEDTKGLMNCESIYPFNKFQEQVAELDKLLKKNGFLVLYNCNFKFEETTPFSKYKICHFDNIKNSGFVTKFDSSNNVLANQHHEACIYLKVSD